jgi:hypothetical protein
MQAVDATTVSEYDSEHVPWTETKWALCHVHELRDLWKRGQYHSISFDEIIQDLAKIKVPKSAGLIHEKIKEGKSIADQLKNELRDVLHCVVHGNPMDNQGEPGEAGSPGPCDIRRNPIEIINSKKCVDHPCHVQAVSIRMEAGKPGPCDLHHKETEIPVSYDVPLNSVEQRNFEDVVFIAAGPQPTDMQRSNYINKRWAKNLCADLLRFSRMAWSVDTDDLPPVPPKPPKSCERISKRLLYTSSDFWRFSVNLLRIIKSESPRTDIFQISQRSIVKAFCDTAPPKPADGKVLLPNTVHAWIASKNRQFCIEQIYSAAGLSGEQIMPGAHSHVWTETYTALRNQRRNNAWEGDWEGSNEDFVPLEYDPTRPQSTMALSAAGLAQQASVQQAARPPSDAASDAATQHAAHALARAAAATTGPSPTPLPPQRSFNSNDNNHPTDEDDDAHATDEDDSADALAARTETETAQQASAQQAARPPSDAASDAADAASDAASAHQADAAGVCSTPAAEATVPTDEVNAVHSPGAGTTGDEAQCAAKKLADEAATLTTTPEKAVRGAVASG